MGIVRMLKAWWYGHDEFVVMDAADNSVTINENVYRHMLLTDGLDEARVIVFSMGREYGFMLNPVLDGDTVVNDLQIDTRTQHIGFESLCPTVNRMLYDYGIEERRVVLTVVPERLGSGKWFYRIKRPKEYGERY